MRSGRAFCGVGIHERVIHHQHQLRDAASSINCRACSEFDANGFSTNTCLPARNAAKAKSKCDETGVAMTIASIDESSIICVELPVVLRFG